MDPTTQQATTTEQRTDVSSTNIISTAEDDIKNTSLNSVTTTDSQTQSSSSTSSLEITPVDKLTMSTYFIDRTTHKTQSDMTTSEQLSTKSFPGKTHLSTGSILTSTKDITVASTTLEPATDSLVEPTTDSTFVLTEGSTLVHTTDSTFVPTDVSLDITVTEDSCFFEDFGDSAVFDTGEPYSNNMRKGLQISLKLKS